MWGDKTKLIVNTHRQLLIVGELTFTVFARIRPFYSCPFTVGAASQR